MIDIYYDDAYVMEQGSMDDTGWGEICYAAGGWEGEAERERDIDTTASGLNTCDNRPTAETDQLRSAVQEDESHRIWRLSRKVDKPTDVPPGVEWRSEGDIRQREARKKKL